ncbi:MAG: hypothetical protein F4087_08020 [Gemmatimonadetes bacterium]|nr:hypothetical protein [Gemmatimonadota bacterium]MYJ68435.1 hypothetical protein [Gemmatimonadota bacterium]
MERLASDLPALPLDIGRIIVGAVLFVYFFNTLRQARDFSDPDGLIDHSLLCRLFPPTRVSLFQPGMPGWLFRAVFVCACVAALMVVAGFHPRPAGAFLFLAALSTLRWNVLASYLDDAMIHIFCLWIVLLPVGSTLNVPDLLAGASGNLAGPSGDLAAGPGSAAAAGTPVLDTWLAATVPGAAPRAFIVNMALVYVVAGLYKFTSPMWRDGSAMHSALRMPIARAPGFWTLRWRTPLRLVTWAALILEPLFALIFVLPPGMALKWLLVAGAIVFHLGIASTLKIPYSNLAMMGAIPLALSPEIMQGWLGAPQLERAVAASPGPAGWIALTLVALITIQVVWEAANTGRRLRPRYSSSGWDNPVRGLLWMFGIFQSYRLFDWVDERNHHVRFEVTRVGGEPPADPGALFPQSMRHLLLQSYLVGNIWMRMSPAQLEQVRRALLIRHARRYARTHPDAGTIEAVAIVQRVTKDNLELTRGERRPMMRFTCRGGRAVMHHPKEG